MANRILPYTSQEDQDKIQQQRYNESSIRDIIDRAKNVKPGLTYTPYDLEKNNEPSYAPEIMGESQPNNQEIQFPYSPSSTGLDITSPDISGILARIGQASNIEQSPTNTKEEQQSTQPTPQKVLKQPKKQQSIVPKTVATQTQKSPQSDEDIALKEAQAKQEKNLSNSMLVRLLGQAAATATGKKLDSQIFDKLDTEAKLPVEQLLQQRQQEGQKVQQLLSKIQLQKTQQSMDPNSQESVTFRKAIEATNPEIARAYGADWNKVSAQDKSDIWDVVKTKEQIDARKEQAKLMMMMRMDEKQKDAYQKASHDMNTYRGNQAVQQAAASLPRVQNALSLAESGRPLSSQDLTLFASEVGRLATGGVPGHAEIAALMPNTASKKLSEIQSFFANKPTDAQANDFIKHNLPYLKDMANNYQNVVNKYKESIVQGYKKRLTPEAMDDLRRDNGILTTPPSNISNSKAKPKTVTQNGHTYTLNEATGEYE